MNVDNRQSTEPASLSRPVSHMIYHLKANFESLIVCAFKRCIFTCCYFQFCHVKYFEYAKSSVNIEQIHWNLKWTSRKLQNVCEKIHEIHLVSDYEWSHMIWCFGYYARCVCSMSVFFIHHCLRWRKYINREKKKRIRYSNDGIRHQAVSFAYQPHLHANTQRNPNDNGVYFDR